MIKDLLISFKDNFKERTTNPFLGTYAIVWIFRNWELIYSLFNFDKSFVLDNKIAFIKNYYSEHNFIENLLSNIYWSLGVLIITYLLLNTSRFIVNLFEKRLTPWIFKITDFKSIVLKTEYDRVRTERDDLQIRLDNERESKSRLEIKIKNLEEEIIKNSDLNLTNKKNESQNGLNKDFNKYELNKVLEKIKEKNLLKEFIHTAVMINKSDTISNDYKPKDDFIAFGLIKHDPKTSLGPYAKKYMMTEEGEQLLKIARFE